MRRPPPTPYAVGPEKGTGQIDTKARNQAPGPTRLLRWQLSRARPETLTVDPEMVAAEDSLARRRQATPGTQGHSRMALGSNRQECRVPPVDPESLPPTSGSMRPA